MPKSIPVIVVILPPEDPKLKHRLLLSTTIHNAICGARYDLSDREITEEIEKTLRNFFQARVMPR
jgi:CRISPR/Cas system CSM-associated protein Csm4 (group 5 of RAMP superfamily)